MPILDVIAGWKKKLLDLTKRNRLLHYRASKSTTLAVIMPDIDGVFARLVVEEKPWIVWEPKEADVAEEADQLPLAALTDSSESAGKKTSFEELLKQQPPSESEIVLWPPSGTASLRKSLSNLYRRSNSDFHEKGVRTLYLGLGQLHWRETEALPAEDEIRSPIILVPVELTRKTANDPFVLKFSSDAEAVFNPTLAQNLKKHFNINLPDFDPEDETASLSKVLAQLQQLVNRLRWKVSNDCVLTLFSFHKLVMFQDLERNEQLLAGHEIIKTLGGEPISRELIVSDLPDESELDRVVDPETTFHLLDADSSQLACLAAAARGQSLVIQGPPGTGKSQTIANLIAETIGAGKTVLFVSEKMAALEVVFKRLKKAGLGDFCLELHSHKSNKREVVQELKRCLESHPTLTTKRAANFPKLRSTRERLNSYVQELHKKRQPLELSVYEVLSRLSKFSPLPLLPLESNANGLTQDEILRLVELAGKLEYVWDIAADARGHAWYGFLAPRFTASLESETRDELTGIGEKLALLAEESTKLALLLGTESPKSLTDVDTVLVTAGHLVGRPQIHRDWLELSNLKPLVAAISEEEIRHKQLAAQIKAVNALYRDAIFSAPGQMATEIESVSGLVATTLRSNDRAAMFSMAEDLATFAEATKTYCAESTEQERLLAAEFGLQVKEPTPATVTGLARLVDICSQEAKPDEKWLDPATLQRTRKLVSGLREKIKTAKRFKESLQSSYHDSLLTLDLERLIGCFSADYKNFRKWFDLQFYRDKQAINRCTKTGTFGESILDDLVSAKNFRDLKAELDGDVSAKEAFNERYRSLETDVDSIEAELKLADDALATMGEISSPQLRRLLSSSGRVSAALKTTADAAVRAAAGWKARFGPVMPLIDFNSFPAQSAGFRDVPLVKLQAWADSLAKSAGQLSNLKGALRSVSIGDLPDYTRAVADLNHAEETRQLTSAVEAARARNLERFGPFYKGHDTDWAGATQAARWVIALKTLLAGQQIPGILLRPDEQRVEQSDFAAIEELLADLKARLKKFDAKFESETNRDGGISYWRSKLCAKHQLSPAQSSLTVIPFAILSESIASLSASLPELRGWADYVVLRAKFEEAGLDDFAKKMVRTPDFKTRVSDVAEKAILATWLDNILSNNPTLAEFRGEEHSAAIEDFAEHDKRAIESAPARLADAVNSRRPQAVLAVDDSEAGTLMREAHKKKRHMPLRILFERIPNTLTRIKPCIMMSPVAVSQFLPSKTGLFDLVVFDEASQICSEDAVGAIYRGKQVVVAGDDKQLPPTSFFRDADQDDEEWSEQGDESGIEFMSVLEQFAATGLPSKMLRWHYRSKDEGLIAFSNAQFYGHRLVTFPAPHQKHEALGVKFVHVPDGVYDRGGRRDNRREAERVAELVFDHMELHPNKTLGVVAFSVAQMTAIEDMIELKRKADDRFENAFAEDRLEGFFVKNLENVQGDERDVMIFSIGYGKDADGRLTGNFGPITRSGGGRRLNVAITRARERVILVSSIRAGDIDLSKTQAPGTLLLQRYLDYAERGPIALQTEITGGETESPFEDDVAAEIKALGYQIASQVGCSGFRIDLGVLCPENPGTFILGVECDGATYHSSYTARDRDRLRAEILRTRGWQLHRIWSSDWFYHRAREIKRLEHAIESARSAPTPPATREPAVAVEFTRKAIDIVYPAEGSEISGTTSYVVATLRAKRRPDLKDYSSSDAREVLATFLRKIVEIESPIHFDLAKKRVAGALQMERAGPRFEEVLRTRARHDHSKGNLRFADEFLWKRGHTVVPVRVPDDHDPASARHPDHICSEEIGAAMELILRQSFSIETEALVVATARLFKFERTGENIRNRFLKILQELCVGERLIVEGTRIVLPRAAGQ